MLDFFFSSHIFDSKTEDLAGCPFPFSSFFDLLGLLWLSLMFQHKGAHLKGLNAKLISYMKQSWFIFPALFFLNLQTTIFLPHPSGITPFNMQSKHWGNVLWTVAMVLRHLSSTKPFSFASGPYLSTAGVEPSPKIAAILKRRQNTGNFIYTPLTEPVIHLIAGKAGWHTLLSAAAASVFVRAYSSFLSGRSKASVVSPKSILKKRLSLNILLVVRVGEWSWCVGCFSIKPAKLFAYACNSSLPSGAEEPSLPRYDCDDYTHSALTRRRHALQQWGFRRCL